MVAGLASSFLSHIHSHGTPRLPRSRCGAHLEIKNSDMVSQKCPTIKAGRLFQRTEVETAQHQPLEGWAECLQNKAMQATATVRQCQRCVVSEIGEAAQLNQSVLAKLIELKLRS